MSDLAFADVLGWIAAVSFIVRLLPQPIRLVRTGIPDGVSPLTAINIAVTELAWFSYGVTSGTAPVWVVSLFAFPLATWTAVLLRVQITRRDAIGAALWAVIVVIAGLAGAIGAVLGLAVITQVGPQVWMALRSDDLDGVAPNAWRLAIVDGLTWGTYGYLIDDAALMFYATALIVFSVVILVRVRQTRSPAVEPA